MGVCGYTYSEVQEMPIDALARAITARKKHDFEPWNVLLSALFGEPESAPEATRPMNIQLFDALFP